jgi:hypothetical protein
MGNRQKKTANHSLISGQFGVILYQPSQVLFHIQEMASKPKNSFISNSSSPVGDTE